MAEVRATILRLIATHVKADASIPWHGADLDFTGLVFTTDVNFTRAVFPGGEVSFNFAVFLRRRGLVQRREVLRRQGFVHGW